MKAVKRFDRSACALYRSLSLDPAEIHEFVLRNWRM